MTAIIQTTRSAPIADRRVILTGKAHRLSDEYFAAVKAGDDRRAIQLILEAVQTLAELVEIEMKMQEHYGKTLETD